MPLSYTGEIKNVKLVETSEDKVNGRIKLSDQTGEVSMILSGSQLNFIKNVNSLSGFAYLIKNEYLKLTLNGYRYFPFVFDGDILVEIYQKGGYSRLLTIGLDPTVSEVYPLDPKITNPRTLQHCFGFIRNQKGKLLAVLPLLQPKKYANGKFNFWSVKTSFLK